MNLSILWNNMKPPCSMYDCTTVKRRNFTLSFLLLKPWWTSRMSLFFDAMDPLIMNAPCLTTPVRRRNLTLILNPGFGLSLQMGCCGSLGWYNENDIKNSDILPTGQWYAPSAVNYSALSCTILHYFTLSCTCTVLHSLALSCTILQNLAPSCTILHYLALSCTILHYFT